VFGLRSLARLLPFLGGLAWLDLADEKTLAADALGMLP
jgi:hypothetical protein